MEKEPIHLFLDTTLTFQDPFFKKNFNHQIIRLSELHHVPIFMSKVVFDETRNKYEQNVKERINGLDTALKDLENYYPTNLDTVTIKCSLDDFMAQFDRFYLDLIDRKILHIIEYDNSILPLLVERSIKRIKPFGSKKQEFRDAITWLSYTQYVETHKLDNCFLITNNVDDFCENKTKNTIHPELLNDSTRFSHFVSSKDLLDSELKLKPYLLSSELTSWLQSFDIDDEFLDEKFNTDLNKQLNNLFIDYVNRCFLNNLVDEDYVQEDCYVETESVSILSFDDLKTTVINDEIVVSGDIIVDVELNLYLDFSYSIDSYIGTDKASVVSRFSFTMDQKNVHKDSLELDNFDVIQLAEFTYMREYFEN